MKVADGEGDGVGSCRSEVVPSPHEALSEGHLDVEVEMEVSASTSAARGPTAPYASVPSGVIIGGAVVIIRHTIGR